MDDRRTTLNKLKNYFGIAQKKGKGFDKTPQPVPAQKPKTDKDKGASPKPLKLTSDAQKMWDWWISETHDTMKSFEDRVTRYNDADYMILNSGIMAMAVELYADEAVQVDSQTKPITVTASTKVQKEIERLLSAWGIDQPTLRALAYDLAEYGDAVTVNSVSIDREKKGYTDVTKVDPREIKDRLEFRLSDIRKAKEGKTQSFVQKMKNKAMDGVLERLQNAQGDPSEAYKPFLFGYVMQTGETLLPWNITHFRLETTKSEFFPFGRSLFINSIANFRQYQGAKNLQALLRGLNFPREHFTVKVDTEGSEDEVWEAVKEAQTEYLNTGENIGKEGFTAGSQVWTPEGLLGFNLISPNIRMNEIQDVELLRDEMIMSSRVPKGYLIVDRGNFGTSGQALLQQFKPFARSVFAIQSAILKGLAQKIRLHFMMTGQFDEEFTDFTLGMQFPVTEEAQDRIRAKTDSLRLSSDVLRAIKDAFGMRDGLPPEVVQKVLSTLSFLEPEDVEQWVQKTAEQEGLLENTAPKKETNKRSFIEELEYQNCDLISRKLTESKKRELSEGCTQNVIYEAFQEAINKEYISEASLNGRHFINSACCISPTDRQVLDTYREQFQVSRKSNNGDLKG